MWSEVGDNNYVILQPSWRNIGIGTFSPDAKLHLKGSVILGDSGTLISKVIKVTVGKNLASIPAGMTSIETLQ